MDAFIIYSGADEDIVLKKVAELKQIAYNFNPLILTYKKSLSKKVKGSKDAVNTDKKHKTYKFKERKAKFEIPFWRIGAEKKIKKAQMIIFFVGKDSCTSKNIDWEIHTAIKYGKPIYTIKLDNANKLNDSLIIHDKFSRQKKEYNKTIDFESIVEIIKEHERGNYKVFNQDVTEIDKTVLFEQYKVFLKTSEDLVSRRQSVNNFYISINSAILAVYGILWTLDILQMYKFFTGLLLSAVGIILSISWIKLLASYGNLNSSKMKIISYIERELPASLYDAEWAALSDTLNKKKYVSFTDSEKRVPGLFIVVYVCVAICGIAFLF